MRMWFFIPAHFWAHYLPLIWLQDNEPECNNFKTFSIHSTDAILQMKKQCNLILIAYRESYFKGASGHVIDS